MSQRPERTSHRVAGLPSCRCELKEGSEGCICPFLPDGGTLRDDDCTAVGHYGCHHIIMYLFL